MKLALGTGRRLTTRPKAGTGVAGSAWAVGIAGMRNSRTNADTPLAIAGKEVVKPDAEDPVRGSKPKS